MSEEYRGKRPTHARPPIKGVSWESSPSDDQMRHRAAYQRTVEDIATHNARETRNVMKRQQNLQRYDASVLIFEDEQENASDWTSVPVETKDPQFEALGFEKPENRSEEDRLHPDNNDGVDLRAHYGNANDAHEALSAHIEELRAINEKHAPKSPRVVRSHEDATKQRKKHLATPLDKRIEGLKEKIEAAFNEENKIKSHGHDFIEHCKWMHRRAVQHTFKNLVIAVSTLNQGSGNGDNQRMVDLLKHQAEYAELYCAAVIIRDCPDMADRMGLPTCSTRATNNIPALAKNSLAYSHEIHRVLCSGSGSFKVLKLKDLVREFVLEFTLLREEFNKWDEQQVLRFSRLTKSISVTGIMPFTVAPTPLQIQQAIDHQEAKKREEEESTASAFHAKLTRLGGRKQLDEELSSISSYSGDGEDSVSSVGSDSSGGASSGTEISRARLVAEIRRAHHDTPFIAGGKVLYAPRRPHTRGSRNLTNMELDAMPLVTGARESVEHGTSLSSPRKQPHPSWQPHIDSGQVTQSDGRGEKCVSMHKHHHRHHHHHHHHNNKAHRQSLGRPKTLKECMLSHETDVNVLLEAYRAENLKFPPSWKKEADEAVATAQQVAILKAEKSAERAERDAQIEREANLRAHGSHHNVYKTEAHGKPPSKHRGLQNLVNQAKKSMNNAMLSKFSSMSYKKVLSLQIRKRSTEQRFQEKMLRKACDNETDTHKQSVLSKRRENARKAQLSKRRAKEIQEFIRRKRPSTSFSKPIVQPGFVQRSRAMQRPQTCAPGKRPCDRDLISDKSSTLIPRPPTSTTGSYRKNTARGRGSGRSWTNRSASAMGHFHRNCSISPRDILSSTQERCHVSAKFDERWLGHSRAPRSSGKWSRPQTAGAPVSLAHTGRNVPRAKSGVPSVEASLSVSQIKVFEKNLSDMQEERAKTNINRFKSGATKRVGRMRMRRMRRLFTESSSSRV